MSKSEKMGMLFIYNIEHGFKVNRDIVLKLCKKMCEVS